MPRSNVLLTNLLRKAHHLSLKSLGILCSVCHETSAQIDAVYNEGADACESFVPVQNVREADSQGLKHLRLMCAWTSTDSCCLNSQTVLSSTRCVFIPSSSSSQ